ncbi:hypothetical protein [Maridesulfovibrio sp.]|uniref:hypothetical protein n=1 Tax=Maridesulfovibrio sp. TaxID=2795000 RepID=UPI002A18D3DE|nr:hypothetical protein [Maridesulfovibrio sp.]
MTGKDVKNPEESWAELVKEFGNDHPPLTPGLSKAFKYDPFSLMWHVSWFKFAGKMIGGRGHVLVYDHLEGLGGWTVACETQSVLTMLGKDDFLERISAGWNSEKIKFLKSEQDVPKGNYGGAIRFDPGDEENRVNWGDFFRSAADLLDSDGVVVAGGIRVGLEDVLKNTAGKNFRHVFMFGRGQVHPCVSPAEAVIVLACCPLHK